MTKIKICGLTKFSDIKAVNDAKPDYIGFVFAESRRRISPENALKLREKLNIDILPVGVFVNEKINTILSAINSGIIEAVQLHGDEDEEYISKLKALSGKTIIKAVSVQKNANIQKYNKSGADFLLFDSGGGGTGKKFDWKLIKKAEKPFFLAGGISVENIREAVKEINPYAVDVSSGAETDGVNDYNKIMELVSKVRF